MNILSLPTAVKHLNPKVLVYLYRCVALTVPCAIIKDLKEQFNTPYPSHLKTKLAAGG